VRPTVVPPVSRSAEPLNTAPAAASFEALLTPLLGPAYATAVHLTRNPADAEDAVQEAVLNALRGFDSFEPGTNFRAWFFRILVNVVYTRFRQARRQGTTIDLEDAPELHLYSRTAELGLHGAVEDPAAVLMDRIDRDAVQAAIASLPDEYRVVATLYFVEDLPYQEIAVVRCGHGSIADAASSSALSGAWPKSGESPSTCARSSGKEVGSDYDQPPHLRGDLRPPGRLPRSGA
jgi:RNA polymerase sigma-70 factor (ECF subfamily)